jgi:hypothetical protein
VVADRKRLSDYEHKRDRRHAPEPFGGRRRLLVKADDEGADRRRKPVTSQPGSVQSGRTIEQVAAEADDA